MSTIDHPYLMMALNNAWANATLYAALTPLSPDDFLAERPGFFASLKATMNHIHQVDLYYVDALEQRGRGRTVYNEAELDDASALARHQSAVDMRLASFCKGIIAETLLQTRQTDRNEGLVTERVDALLLHLFQHQIHHRGQAHVQLQDAGIAPPQLDEFHLTYDRAPTAEMYFR